MRSILFVTAALALAAASTDAEELGFAGVGARQCQFLNANAVPGRGSGQNLVTQLTFTWAQGYMSGFNGYSLGINRGYIDLGAASQEAQWEYIVSYCRSHPDNYIVHAVQNLQGNV